MPMIAWNHLHRYIFVVPLPCWNSHRRSTILSWRSAQHPLEASPTQQRRGRNDLIYDILEQRSTLSADCLLRYDNSIYTKTVMISFKTTRTLAIHVRGDCSGYGCWVGSFYNKRRCKALSVPSEDRHKCECKNKCMTFK